MNAIPKDFTDAIEAQFKTLGSDVQQALEKAKVTEAIMLDLEQKYSRMPSDGGSFGETKSWGQQFAEADGLKSFADEHSRPGRFRMEVKATIGSAPTSGGSLTPAHRDTTLMMPQRRLLVRDLLPVVQISTGAVEYPAQTARTNAANTVAEGALKPESEYGFTLRTLTPKVIAHWVPASRQILEDAPQLKGIIDSELLHGLALKEDAQVLNGDGTGENLSGLITNATAYSAPIDPVGTETMIDTIALGMLQTTLADFTPTGIVMHPSDWMRIRLLKNADGEYLLGEPGAQVSPTLFGLPVVATTSMSVDKFLIGDFKAAATLYDRWTPRVEVSTEHSDFFTRNLVAILAEERIALATKQPLALTFGDFGNVA